jgi:hypothetical protein
MAIPNLFTIKQFIQRHPAFTEGGLRDRIFHADGNGMKDVGVIIKNGRRVLINEDKFFVWLQET